jgi:type IX secretion system PorP/SprF family membrane protein
MFNNKFFYSILLFASLSYGQQLPQYSQYLRNQYIVNPGAAGVYDFTDVTVGGRMQWVGFSNSPMSTYFSITSPLSTKHTAKEKYNPSLHLSTGPVKNPEIKTGKFKHAVGGQVVADQYGAFRKVQFAGTYAIHLPITRTYNLSFGTKLGLSNNTFLQDRAVVSNVVDDKTYSNYTLNQGNSNIFNIGVGLYLYSNNLFFGISSDQLTKNMVTFGSGTANYDPRIHTNIIGGYKIPLGESLSLTPAFLVKYMSPVPAAIEGSLQLEFKEWIWMAVSYRHKDAIVGMIGMNISNRIKFGYSYDYSISQLKSYSTGGHELILGLMLGR